MNSVQLIGNLCADPILRTSQNGIAATRITVAVNRMPNANGERIADYINVVVWRKQAENLVKYCSKGSRVAIEGKIQSRSYDGQDGNKKYITEVIAAHIEFLGNKPKVENQNTSEIEQTPPSTQSQVQTEEDPFGDFASEVVIRDEDLPF